MGKTTNEAVNAREKARKRMLALHADRAARDTRIETAAARAITAAEKTTAIRGEADAARADARLAYEAALTKIDAAEQAGRSKAEPAMTAALAELAAEKLTVAEIAALTDVAVTDVRRLLKSSSAAAATPNGSSAAVASVEEAIAADALAAQAPPEDLTPVAETVAVAG